jgi:outer membrane lipoprotein SlyB
MSRSPDTFPEISPAAAGGNKALWAVVAVLGATVVGMGGYMLRGPTQPVESGASAVPALVVPAAPVATTAVTPTSAAPSPVLTATKAGTPAQEKKTPSVAKPATVVSKSAPTSAHAHTPTFAHSTAPTTPSPAASTVLVAAGAPVAHTPQVFMPSAPAPKPLCLSCGTVTSVTPIQHDGVGSGTGAMAGGVIGGLLGNQVGGGDGKALATILGAIGGGFAGNAVEKKMKKETVYQVEVRMDDGSTRSFEQAAHASVGAKVIIEGEGFRPAY